MKNSTMKKILVLGAKERDHEALAGLDRFEYHYLDLNFSARFNTIPPLEKYLDKARHIIIKENISGILYSFDLTSLLASILCEEFNLPGPSFESTFICYHKYYQTHLLNPELRCEAYLIDDLKENAFNYPYYLKPPSGSAGVLCFVINNENDLNKCIKLCTEELPKMNENLIPVFNKYLDVKKFPLSTKNVMLIEKYISEKQMTIEGYIFNKKVNITVITDTNNYKDSRLIDNFSIPSVIQTNIRNSIIEKAKEDILKTGLNNTFFNIEYWYDNHDSILIEINSRAATCFYNLYKEIYDYDVYEAQSLLCLGIDPEVKLKTPVKIGGQYNIITLKEGDSSKIFDYELPVPFHINRFINEHHHIHQLSEFGIVIEQIEIFGSSYNSINRKADNWRKALLK